MAFRHGKSEGDSAEEPPWASILILAKGLEEKGVSLTKEFGEMILTSVSEDPSKIAPTRQAAEVMAADPSRAEDIAARMVMLTAAFAFGTEREFQEQRDLMSLVTLYAIRFEAYLAERTAGDPFT